MTPICAPKHIPRLRRVKGACFSGLVLVVSVYSLSPLCSQCVCVCDLHFPPTHNQIHYSLSPFASLPPFHYTHPTPNFSLQVPLSFSYSLPLPHCIPPGHYHHSYSLSPTRFHSNYQSVKEKFECENKVWWNCKQGACEGKRTGVLGV